MSLESKAQELVVIEPEKDENNLHKLLPWHPVDVEVIEDDMGDLSEHHEQLLDVVEDVAETAAEVAEDVGADEFVIVIDDIPGAPRGTEAPSIEVVEEDDDEPKEKESSEKEDEDKLEAPRGRWDWQYNEPHQFLSWIQERVNEVPNHSGYDTAGLERAIAYLERLDTEISKAMRLDLDGLLDANKIEKVRSEIDNGLNKLYDRRDAIRETKRRGKKKKATLETEITKEGQKSPGINGVMVTVPLLISRLARVCINSVVSAGKDMEDMFNQQCEEYNLDNREKAELQQLLDDMGYPMHYDRGHKPDDTYSPSDRTNFDWNQNFPG